MGIECDLATRAARLCGSSVRRRCTLAFYPTPCSHHYLTCASFSFILPLFTRYTYYPDCHFLFFSVLFLFCSIKCQNSKSGSEFSSPGHTRTTDYLSRSWLAYHFQRHPHTRTKYPRKICHNKILLHYMAETLKTTTNIQIWKC